jgi:hypothetical protein
VSYNVIFPLSSYSLCHTLSWNPTHLCFLDNPGCVKYESDVLNFSSFSIGAMTDLWGITETRSLASLPRSCIPSTSHHHLVSLLLSMRE